MSDFDKDKNRLPERDPNMTATGMDEPCTYTTMSDTMMGGTTDRPSGELNVSGAPMESNVEQTGPGMERTAGAGIPPVEPVGYVGQTTAQEGVGDTAQEYPATTGDHPTTMSDIEKPSIGDKIKGNIEKLAGKITGNEALVTKGENIASGRSG